MSKKHLVLVRHGQTLFNLKGRIQGWCDSPLTELGIQQAQACKKELEKREYHFDKAYSSTSGRARQTMEEIYQGEYEALPGLMEMNFGMLEGDPEEWHPNFFWHEEIILENGGDSREQVARRMTKTIKEILKEAGDQFLIVSHGASIFYALCFLVKKEPPFPQNCSFYVVEYDENTDDFTLMEYWNNPLTERNLKEDED